MDELRPFHTSVFGNARVKGPLEDDDEAERGKNDGWNIKKKELDGGSKEVEKARAREKL